MKFGLVLLAILLSSCTTIHFDNGSRVTVAGQKTEKWHHNIALSLYELSEPIDLSKECLDQEWSSVQTQVSFINGLASGVLNGVVPGLWYPKTVQVSCDK